MKVIILDGTNLTSKAEAHRYMKEMLGFPDYYGANLDALDDCLSELSGDTAVVIINAEAAKSALGGYADGILEDFIDVLGPSGRVTII